MSDKNRMLAIQRKDKSLEQWLSNFSVCRDYLEGLLKHRSLDPLSDFLTEEDGGGAQESTFLTGSQ